MPEGNRSRWYYIQVYGIVSFDVCCLFVHFLNAFARTLKAGANSGFFLAATAMQHLCLAKALMLIRETEVYENSAEQRVAIKVNTSSGRQIAAI